MKFKQGDKVRVIKRYEGWLEVGQVYTIVNNPKDTINIHTEQRGIGGFLISDGHFELAVPVFDEYRVYVGTGFIDAYGTFDEAEVRAKGLAEGGKTVTIKGFTAMKDIATVACPPGCAVTTFADAS